MKLIRSKGSFSEKFSQNFSQPKEILREKPPCLNESTNNKQLSNVLFKRNFIGNVFSKQLVLMMKHKSAVGELALTFCEAFGNTYSSCLLVSFAVKSTFTVITAFT